MMGSRDGSAGMACKIPRIGKQRYRWRIAKQASRVICLGMPFKQAAQFNFLLKAYSGIKGWVSA